MPDPATRAERCRQSARLREIVRRSEEPVCTILQFQPGERPLHGAEVKRADRIGQACLDQRLRTHHRARVAGTMGHDRTGRIVDRGQRTVEGFAVRAIESAGDAVFPVLVEWPGIEDDRRAIGVHHLLQPCGIDSRSPACPDDVAAKGLADHVPAHEQASAVEMPARKPAFHDPNVTVAQVAKHCRASPCRCPVAQDDRHVRMEHMTRRIDLKAAEREVARGKQVSAVELVNLARIDDGELTVGGEELPILPRSDDPVHVPGASLWLTVTKHSYGRPDLENSALFRAV